MSSTNITSSGTLTYSSGDETFSYSGSYTGDINTWPITVSAGVKVTFGSDLTLTTTTQYFTIGGSAVTIDGAGYEVDFSGIDTADGPYDGFINGGSQANSTVENIGCIGSGIIDINQIESYISIGSFTATSSISNCYVICGGFITHGIAGLYNSASISNCYVICGGNIEGGGGIAGQNNSGTISNCYVICGGSINFGGGIAGFGNSESISNCYVICGGNITGNVAGGIACSNNESTGTISNCYVICGGNIAGGGIAGSNNSATISNCYVNYNTVSGGSIFASSGSVDDTTCGSSNTPTWTSAGASKLLPSSAWTNYDSTKPWVLSAFDTAIASSTTATSTSGTIALNTYGETFANGSVYSGTNGATFTYNAPSNISYSGISSGITYTLGLYAYELLSNLTSITFTFTNDAAIQTAFNYTGTSANDIVPYTYSLTDDVTLNLDTTETNYYSSTSGSDLIYVFKTYTSGTKTTTNYQVNGQDLSDIFQPYSSEPKAETTGITVNGNDLNNIFQNKNI